MLVGGLGGNCKDALVDMINQYTRNGVAFYTDEATDKNIPFFEQAGMTVYKGEEAARKYFAEKGKNFVSFIGNNYYREKQANFLKQIGGTPAKYISKTAMVNESLSTISDHNAIIM